METLTKKQKKRFLERITPDIAKQFTMVYAEKYDQQEIYALTGVAPNRQSEINNYTKYMPIKSVINEKVLGGLIGGGLVDLNMLLKKEDLTDAEKAYLETFIIYKNKRMAEAAIALEKAGFDPGEILYEAAKSRNAIK